MHIVRSDLWGRRFAYSSLPNTGLTYSLSFRFESEISFPAHAVLKQSPSKAMKNGQKG
jgi:hypothetical protein